MCAVGPINYGPPVLLLSHRYGKASLDHIYRLCLGKGEKPVVQPPDLGDEESAHIRDEVDTLVQVVHQVQRAEINFSFKFELELEFNST